MNQTVARIVEIMFQDTVMTDEVLTLKEEVMNNCQERYEDMLARGMNEDEAIGAVVDSLKGMEEVIAQYPRKEAAVAEEEAIGEQDLVFATSQVNEIRVLSTSDDVNFETSMDDYIHVYYDKEEMPYLYVTQKNGILSIERRSEDEVRVKKQESKKEDSGSEWQSLSDMLGDIGKMLSNLKVNLNFTTGGGEMTIAVPEDHAIALDVHVTSGDIDIDGLKLKQAMIETTSGDVTVTMADGCVAKLLKVKGSSGDVEVNGPVESLSIGTVSGDVEYTGDCPNIDIHTISGDAELNGMMETVYLKTISGDVYMWAKGDHLRNVTCNTTSGDLTLNLPASMRGQVAINMHSTSGDVHNRFGEALGAPLARVDMNSVSGDLTIK